jgi:ATP/maltotriose-dependent transcriptional regulator MalT
VAAGDLDSATHLVDGIAADLLVRAEANKLVKFVEQLPSDLYQDYPMLCILRAWALVFMGQPEMAEQALTGVETHPKKAPGVPNPGYVATVRAYLATQQGDYLKSIQLTEQALEEMSSAAPASPDRITIIFQGSAVIWLGVNHRELGNLDKARQLFMEAARLNQKAGNYYAALASLSNWPTGGHPRATASGFGFIPERIETRPKLEGYGWHTSRILDSSRGASTGTRNGAVSIERPGWFRSTYPA